MCNLYKKTSMTFPWLFGNFLEFHDFFHDQKKFHDFSMISMTSGHPDLCYLVFQNYLNALCTIDFIISYENKICFIISNLGFKPCHSTDQAIIELTNQIYNSFNENKLTLGLFIDLSKAFDTVNHQNHKINVLWR